MFMHSGTGFLLGNILMIFSLIIFIEENVTRGI